MLISVIIPTLNEEANILPLLDRINDGGGEAAYEIIVIDGGSVDATKSLVKSRDGVLFKTTEPGRALQMNKGVEYANGDILYFVHGDTMPPRTFIRDILEAVREGFDLGCYRFKFDGGTYLLRINAFFTRFARSWCRGGDQSLFIKRSVFESLGGYEERYVIMEDFELLRRAVDKFRFKIMDQEIIVSARKYHNNNYLQVQLANLVVFNMFKFGYEPQRILNTYRKLINYRS